MNDEDRRHGASPRRIVASSMRQWPQGCRTKTSWKYEHDRFIRAGEKPTIFEIEGRAIPVYALLHTYRPRRKRSELQQARHEHNRYFWLHARYDRYLLCDDGTSTIDYHAQRERGSDVPWFAEAMVGQHLRGESVYGVFAEESFEGRQAQTYWVAADLDLHLATGGNLDLFVEQVKVILRHCWGKLGSQVVIARERANGLHI